MFILVAAPFGLEKFIFVVPKHAQSDEVTPELNLLMFAREYRDRRVEVQ